MAAISLDLRKRILDALEEDSSSLRVGKRFSVSPSFVRKLRIQVRETGDPTAGKAPGKERLVKGATERRLRKLAAKRPDATLVELSELLARATDVAVSETTMWRSLRRLGLTRKKSPSKPRNGSART
jgi:putative transposase